MSHGPARLPRALMDDNAPFRRREEGLVIQLTGTKSGERLSLFPSSLRGADSFCSGVARRIVTGTRH
jgi:hypothetical protein